MSPSQTARPSTKNPRRVNNYPYRDLSKALFRKSKRTGAPCWICGLKRTGVCSASYTGVSSLPRV